MSDPETGDDPGAGPAARKARKKAAGKPGKKTAKGSGKKPGKAAVKAAAGAKPERRTKPAGRASRDAARDAVREMTGEARSRPAAPRPASLATEAAGTGAKPANHFEASSPGLGPTVAPGDAGASAAETGPTEPPPIPEPGGSAKRAGAKKGAAGKSAAKKTGGRKPATRETVAKRAAGKVRGGRAGASAPSSPARSAGTLLAEAAKFTVGLLRAVAAPAVAPFVAGGGEGGEGGAASAEPAPRAQVGVLPMRRGGDGRLRILLVTSRETRRWVIPKGWPMRGRAPHEAAAREAFEEAGLVGRVGDRAVGRYAYRKRLKEGTVTCVVEVFPFRVRKRLKTWPEKRQRTARWFALEEAASLVAEPDLAALIREAGTRARKKGDAAGPGGWLPPRAELPAVAGDEGRHPSPSPGWERGRGGGREE